ncbi:MAG TPA: DUF2207 domain-containing protein [Anaerolineales bacterium]|nr:DUF2207 domain-containing protein [Anaerolineales bacterium]
MRWVLLLALGLLLVGWPRSAAAQGKTLYWERFDVTLAIQPNGDLKVVERQRIRFTAGSFTYGFALIPLDKTQGIDQVSLSEPGGTVYQEASFGEEPFTFETSQVENELEVRWYFPPTADSARTFDLAYTVHGAIRVYDSGDKLQWFAIDDERDFPIEESSVTVLLPPGAAFQIIDSAGAEATWSQSADGTSVTFLPTGPLSSTDVVEVGIEFSHGAIPAQVPGWQAADDDVNYYNDNVKDLVDLGLGVLAVLILLGGPALIYFVYYARGRDPKVGPVPEYLAEPPGDLPPGIMGTLLDEQAEMRDVVATIVDLARKGSLRIEETANKGLLGLGSTDFIFHRQASGADGLNPVESEVVAGLFRGGKNSVEMSDLREKFYTRLPAIQSKLYQEMVSRGFFRTNPDTTRKLWRGLGGAVLVGAFFLGMFATGALSSYTSLLPCVFGALGLTGLIALVSGGAMPAKTRKGAEAAAQWKAFKTYLERIDKLADLQQVGELFERYLPYAIALGIKDSWIHKFSQQPMTPVPGWYMPYYGGGGSRPTVSTGGKGGGTAVPPLRGPGGLQGMSEGLAGGLQSMSDGLTRMLNSAGRVLQSAPSSSGRSGGGFSGGGFSGGGGGGGGGRGFG